MKRRDFIKLTSGAILGTVYLLNEKRGEGKNHTGKKAMYWEPLREKKIRCRLCPHECITRPGERGICQVRENRDGVYYSVNYGKVVAMNNDPIEKKPLFHYKPGSYAFSIATAGCNIRCQFCQNWEISQFPPEEVKYLYLSPNDVVELALRKGSSSIAFTYSEPIIFYEYMYDIAKLAKERGIGGVMISNGFINPTPMRELTKVLDAVKIDFKSFKESFYTKICQGHLRPVLDTLLLLKKEGIWFEIVVLIIPTLNDSEIEIKSMSRWIKQNLGTDVPLHFTRFHPTYRMTHLPPTPVSTLEKAHDIAVAEGLHFVYIGNVPGHPYENTYCVKTKKVLIRRIGFRVIENHIKNGKCPYCGNKVPGVWS